MAIDGNNSGFQYLDDFATRILLPIEGLASDLRSGRIPDAWLSIWQAFRGSHAKNILFHQKTVFVKTIIFLHVFDKPLSPK